MELKLGVDELTLVIKFKPDLMPKITSFNWEHQAELIIKWFEQKAGFINIFGERVEDVKPPQGYKIAYGYGNHSHYLSIAYHPDYKAMGVCVKFSAKAFAHYSDKSGNKVYQFLQSLKHPYYSSRLSRIDFFADFFDCEVIDINKIYQGLVDKTISVFREQLNKNTGLIEYRKVPISYQSILKGDEMGTLYLGSVKSPSRLRIYDKKTEQLETKGTYLELAKSCNSWIRFEAVFRHHYAHQLTRALLLINNNQEFTDLIASTLIQKYRMMYVVDGVVDDDSDTEFIQLLQDALTNQSFTLQSSSTRNNNLLKSILHMFSGSGLISTLQKIQLIWDRKAVDDFLFYVAEFANEVELNNETNYWLRKNLEEHREQYPSFGDYMRDFVIPWLQEY